MHQRIVSPGPFFKRIQKNAWQKHFCVVCYLSRLERWFFENWTVQREKSRCASFKKKETAKNLSKKGKKKSSRNKQSIMESLILAQDERWRRA